MGEMLKFTILACLPCWLLICASAEYTVKCNNISASSISFEPSADGVKGRYTVVWCTEVDKNVTEWDMLIRFYESRKPEKCKTYDLRHPPPLGLAHSHLRQNVNLNLNCTNVSTIYVDNSLYQTMLLHSILFLVLTNSFINQQTFFKKQS